MPATQALGFILAFLRKSEIVNRYSDIIRFLGALPRTPVTFFVLETKKVTKESSRPQLDSGKTTLRRSYAKTNICRERQIGVFLGRNPPDFSGLRTISFACFSAESSYAEGAGEAGIWVYSRLTLIP